MNLQLLEVASRVSVIMSLPSKTAQKLKVYQLTSLFECCNCSINFNLKAPFKFFFWLAANSVFICYIAGSSVPPGCIPMLRVKALFFLLPEMFRQTYVSGRSSSFLNFSARFGL